MPSSERDHGFTLIELLVVIVLMGAMMAIAVGGWASWSRASEQSGTAHEVESTLRAAQQRAVTEGRSHCVMFDPGAGTWTVYRGACDESKVRVLGPFRTRSPDVRLTAPQFTSYAGVVSQGVTFRARGTAWAGRVTITRQGSAKAYTVSVERLTGRVSLS
jgi:type II secretion system protein H